MVSIWSVLARNRDFRRLFLAELVMFGGDWFVIVRCSGCCSGSPVAGCTAGWCSPWTPG
jgi:hypothetical protein